MGNLFNMEGGLMTALSKFFDICFISILWVICSIPLITIGASTTALYYGIVKVIRHDRGYVGREFFHSFKTNFASGTILWIIIAALSGLLYFNMKLAGQMGGNQGYLLVSVYRAMAFILLCVTAYIFPNLSRFTMGKKQLIQTSLFMSMKHLPITIVVVVILVLTMLAVQIMPVTLLFLPGVSCFLCSLLIEKVLRKYMPKKEGEEDQASDEWYLE